MERLKALEHSDSTSPAATAGGAVPTTVAAGRSWGLIRWLSIGFAGLLAGGIALLAAVADNAGDGSATASRSAVGLAVSPLVADDSIKMSWH
jgi:hypothetical protein